MQLLTVVICTCNRPALLRDALVSVAIQTKLPAVQKVIVSENSESTDSEAICAEFKSLPIEYIKQPSPLPAMLHFNSLRDRVKTPVVALLHDDDWWMPDHLESSLLALDTHKCIACFSNFVEAPSTRHPVHTSYKSLRVWAVSGRDFSKDVVLLDPVENFLLHLLSTSVHYSTFVGYAHDCWEAYGRVVQTNNSFDNDRSFPIFLGDRGGIAYIPKLSAGIRIHPGQDCAQPQFQNGWERYVMTTAYLSTNYPGMMMLARDRFNNVILPLLAGDEVVALANSIGDPQRLALIDQCGLSLPRPHPQNQGNSNLLNAAYRTKVAQFKYIVKQIFRKV